MRGFPFDRLPRLSRADADARGRHARGPLTALSRGAEASGEWLGLPVRLEVDGAPARPSSTLDPTLAALLEDAAGTRAALLLDPAIALLIVERIVGGDVEELVDAPLSDLECGLLAHAISRWLREGGSRFGVAAVLTSGAALAEALGARDSLLRWPLALRIGAARGNAALVIAEHAPVEDAPVTLPACLAAAPIELAITAGRAELDARTVASLEPGDVVVPDGCSLRVEDGVLSGRVRLESGRAAWLCTLAGDALEMIHGELCAPSSAAEVSVKSAEDDALLERMGGTKVTLVVELARLTLPLAQLAALAPGEVLRADTPIGEPVVLRAGDQVIAEGELVDVDGELGVRITRLG